MKKIAVMIADLFEDSEYGEPVRAFRDAGHQVVTIGLQGGKTVTGKTEKTRVKVERSIQCLLYTSPSPRDRTRSRMPSSA